MKDDWKTIDSKPNDGEKVLGYWSGFSGEQYAIAAFEYEMWIVEGEPCCEPTHWMPVPNPPNDVKPKCDEGDK